MDGRMEIPLPLATTSIACYLFGKFELQMKNIAHVLHKTRKPRLDINFSSFSIFVEYLCCNSLQKLVEKTSKLIEQLPFHATSHLRIDAGFKQLWKQKRHDLLRFSYGLYCPEVLSISLFIHTKPLYNSRVKL